MIFLWKFNAVVGIRKGFGGLERLPFGASASAKASGVASATCEDRV